MPTACRPNRPADPAAHKREGRVLRLVRRGDRRGARRRCRGRAAALRHRAGRQRAERSAGRVHRPEHPLHRGLRQRHRRRTGRTDGEALDALERIRQRLFERARDAPASAPRRQGPDGVERPDDRGVRACGAGAAWAVRTPPPIATRRSRAATFIRATLWHARPTACCGATATATRPSTAYAEDYACLIWGLLELFQATGDAAWLEWAIALQARQDELFWDEADGGWFSTTGRDPSVLLRLKEDYDGAEPSASSVAALNVADARAPDRRCGVSRPRGPNARALRSESRRRRRGSSR